jgi:arylsulfatase A-like enzyme
MSLETSGLLMTKMYSELVNVPLIIYEPAQQGEVCDTLVSTIDVSPTLVSFFGLNRVEA